jgi:hypothetical protein
MKPKAYEGGSNGEFALKVRANSKAMGVGQ